MKKTLRCDCVSNPRTLSSAQSIGSQRPANLGLKLVLSSYLEEVERELSEAKHVSSEVDPGDEVAEEVVGGQRVAEQDLGQVVVKVSAGRCLVGVVKLYD